MDSRFSRYLQLSLAALDLLSINAVFFTTIFLFKEDVPADAYIQYSYFGFFLNAGWIIVTVLSNLYHEKNVLSFEQFTKRTAHIFIFYLFLVGFYLYFFHQFYLSRAFIIVVLTGISIGLLVNRFVYFFVSYYLRKKTTALHERNRK